MSLKTLLLSVAGFAVITALWMMPTSSLIRMAIAIGSIVAAIVCFSVLFYGRRKSFAVGAMLPLFLAVAIFTTGWGVNFPILTHEGRFEMPSMKPETPVLFNGFQPDALQYRHRHQLAWLALGLISGLITQSILRDERRRPQEKDNH
ncbi:MAG: hypothetical protein WBD20_15665 [Pirellulaceae bacterium]